jgi:hypothetical protein
MRAERERRRPSHSARHRANCIVTQTMRTLTRISIGRIKLMTTVTRTRLRLAATRLTDGVFTTCTGTYGNGARTGMGITQPAQRVILSVLRTAPSASGAVVPGATRRTTPVPRFGAGTGPPSATTPWASASVSDHQQASRRSEDSGSRRAERSLCGERLRPSEAPKFFLANCSEASIIL